MGYRDRNQRMSQQLRDTFREINLLKAPTPPRRSPDPLARLTVDRVANLIALRIFEAHDTDTCSLLMSEYGVPDTVIVEMAAEIAKAVVGHYKAGADDSR